jgi:hypothetical protein
LFDPRSRSSDRDIIQATTQEIHGLGETGDSIRPGTGDRSRLSGIPSGYEARDSVSGAEDAGAKGIGSGTNRPVECQLTDDHSSSQVGDLTARCQDAEGNWEVVVSATLWKIGRSQIDGDGAIGESDPGRGDRSAYPVLCFPDGGIRQTRELEGLALTPDVGLHPYRAGLTSHECYRRGRRIHGSKVWGTGCRWKGSKWL